MKDLEPIDLLPFSVPITILFLIGLLPSCLPHHPTTSSKYTVDTRIENGVVYEQASLPGYTPGSRLVVPTGSEVIVDENTLRPVVVIEKRLGVLAYPTKGISIHETKKRMGIVARYGEEETRLATFGEYELKGHGGVSAKLTVTAGPGTEVTFAEELGGAKSVGRKNVDGELPGGEAWVTLETVETF